MNLTLQVFLEKSRGGEPYMRKLLKSVMVPVLVALAISAVPVQLGYGQNSNDQGEDDRGSVNMLLDLFEKANNTLYNVLTTVEDRKGEPLPDVVWAHYDTGLARAREAVQLRNEARYQEAKAKALEAMQRLRQGMVDVADDFEEVQTEGEQTAYRARGIEDAVERVRARIERLEQIAQHAEERGMNASRIKERLGNVTGLLSKVRARIEAGDINEAAREMNMSQRWLGEAMAALKPVIDTYKANQAASFLDNVEEHLSSTLEMIRSTISELNVPEQVKAQITEQIEQAIQTAQNTISQARERLQAGDVDNAMPNLSELRNILPGLLTQLRGSLAQHKPGFGYALESIHRYEVILDVLQENAEVLKEKGIDTSELEAKIQELHDMILQTITDLREDKDVEELRYQIEDLIEEIKALIEQLETEAESS